MRKLSTVALGFVLVLMLVAGSARAEESCRHPGTPEEAKALAERAAEHLRRYGPETAFPGFLDPTAGFMERDLYVFVFDQDGLMWVNGRFPELIGSNVFGTQAPDGRFVFFDGLQKVLRHGRTWIQYTWYNPCTQKLQPKASFLMKVGPFIVGVGVYGMVGA
ncbi:MAG: cache domain-containing protein [Alphaproteobacteria bacterium]|jgi:cytochrome c|nr:cache domain-containing protein [Alphaproteobacteria bacterium]